MRPRACVRMHACMQIHARLTGRGLQQTLKTARLLFGFVFKVLLPLFDLLPTALSLPQQIKNTCLRSRPFKKPLILASSVLLIAWVSLEQVHKLWRGTVQQSAYHHPDSKFHVLGGRRVVVGNRGGMPVAVMGYLFT